MAIYKITNITNLLDKRHQKYKTILDIVYNDEMMKKILKLGIGQTKFMEFSQKPISLQKLAMKGLVSVREVSKKEVPLPAPPKPKLEKPIKLKVKSEPEPAIKKIKKTPRDM